MSTLKHLAVIASLLLNKAIKRKISRNLQLTLAGATEDTVPMRLMKTIFVEI